MQKLSLFVLAACAATSTEPPPARAAACADGPADLDALETVPVTTFYSGDLRLPDPPPAATFAVETAIQREWSVVQKEWAPEGATFGSLDADPEDAGHGVLLGAYRPASCGLTVGAVEAWRLPDDATYVALALTDAGGACEAEAVAGAAVAVPIADFPFSGAISWCVAVLPAD
jgi:hypothetical protein